MTTVAQVRQLLRPLLDRHADLALVGRWLFVKPVHHFARAVLVGRVLNPAQFDPVWAVVHLFEYRRTFPLKWSEFLGNSTSRTPGIWDMADRDIGSKLVDEIERSALPRLRAMKTLGDYLDYISNHFFRHHLLEWPDAKIIVEAALGNIDAAQAICREHLDGCFRDNPAHDDDSRRSNRMVRELCDRVVERDAEGIAKLLHSWEAATAKNLKIEQIWEPTPFPIEAAESR
jgi:hypothetical protein